MNFVLIVFIAFGNADAIHSQQIEFKTMDACMKARVAIKQDYKASSPNGSGRYRIVASCVKR